MWKRDASPKPAPPNDTDEPRTTPAPPEPPPAPPPDVRRGGAEVPAIGKSVVITGQLNGSENLTIEGKVDGTIELRENVLTVGPNGKVKAQIFAGRVVVLGTVTGDITASEKIEIRDGGSVDGDVKAPRVAIADGAHFRGSIDMQAQGARTGPTPQAPKPPRETGTNATR